jgi:hypothetical protein
MIERYVFIRLEDPHATPAGRAAVVAETLRVLPALPGVLSVAVGTPADDDSARAWDVSIVVRFARVEDIDGYAEHPDHVVYVDDFLAPRMKVIKAWNFQVG